MTISIDRPQATSVCVHFHLSTFVSRNVMTDLLIYKSHNLSQPMRWVRLVNSIYERQHLLLSSGILDDIMALDPRRSAGIGPGSMGRQPRIAPCLTGRSSDVTARDIQSWLLQRCHLAEHLADRSGASGSFKRLCCPLQYLDFQVLFPF